MLMIHLPAAKFFDENTEEYISVPATSLRLEHSLISLSKWESKWKKSFMAMQSFSRPEFLDYIRCMSMDKEPDYWTLSRIGPEEIRKITDYIRDPMTATTFGKSYEPAGRSRVVTAEILYYSMFKAGIPIECEKWHLNRLTTLIRVFAEKDNPKKSKGNSMDAARARAAANEARRKRLNTKG